MGKLATQAKVVKRAYKFRFYPTADQAELLMRTFGCVRLVYNRALEVRTTAWVQRRESLGYSDTSALLTSWKRTDELSFLNEVSSVPLQQTLRHLQSGFAAFWAKRADYPTFKSRRKSKLAAEFTRSAFSWNEDSRELKLAKMSDPLDIRWSREIPVGALPSSVTVSRDAAHRWYVSILVEEEITPLAKSTNAVGVDLGVTDALTLSDGRKVSHPHYLRADLDRLARAQRAFARTQKGSRNREKARLKVARAYARVADRRRDWLHQLSTALIRENQTIVLEDLAVQAMTRSGKSYKTGLNRAVLDASWRELRSMLEYKADWYGREVIVIDRWFPSSQLCSACGAIDGKKPLHIRQWSCCSCGASHDRDINAAKNILAAGLAVSVCGDGRSLRSHAAA